MTTATGIKNMRASDWSRNNPPVGRSLGAGDHPPAGPRRRVWQPRRGEDSKSIAYPVTETGDTSFKRGVRTVLGQARVRKSPFLAGWNRDRLKLSVFFCSSIHYPLSTSKRWDASDRLF
jgi:hypothetical protein